MTSSSDIHRTASPTTVAFRALPSDIQALSFDAVGHLPRPMSHMEMLLAVGQAVLAERQRSKIDEIEIDDGQMTVRMGTLSITVFASSVTLYDTSKDIPAKKVPLYRDVFFKDAAPFLSAAPTPPGIRETME